MICSTGGTSLKDLDDLVTFCENRNLPLAINHCVSLYPVRGQRSRIEPDRFPAQPLSRTTSSGSRPTSTTTGTRRCKSPTRRARARSSATSISTPTASRSRPIAACPRRSIPGSRPSTVPRPCAAAAATRGATSPSGEAKYLNALVRGVYAKRDLPKGHILQREDMGERCLPRHSAAKGTDFLP